MMHHFDYLTSMQLFVSNVNSEMKNIMYYLYVNVCLDSSNHSPSNSAIKYRKPAPNKSYLLKM